MTTVKRLAAVRERTEDLERASLSTWGTLASESKGRDRYEEPDPLRTAFQLDRQRIVASEAFRRLADKTHSFVAAGTARRRVRLVHTVEVAQVAGTIARALRLNEDLVDAIALGCDLGSTAYAQAGEQALSVVADRPFFHNEQSLRVVEHLEGDARGLNLTWEVRDGILNHTRATPEPATAEGQVVQAAVRIASAGGELRAALDSGLLTLHELPDDVVSVLGSSYSQWVTTMVADVVMASMDQPEVRMGVSSDGALQHLEQFLSTGGGGRSARAEVDRAAHCLASLAVFYLENDTQLPTAHNAEEVVAVRVLDHVAALTDQEVRASFAARFLPGEPPPAA